jgi:membrane protein required for colicin V production
MIIDIMCLILVVLAVFKGISRGFIVAVFSFIAFIVGLAAALKLSAVVADSLEKKTGYSGYWLPILSFMLVFIAFVFAIRWGAALVKKAAGIVFLGWVDSLLGALLYVAMYLMVFSVILFFATRMYLLPAETRETSKTYPYVAPYGPKVMAGVGKVIPLFSHMFTDLGNFFDGVAKKHKS